MEYKGFQIKIIGEQGNGEFNTPLTNTPYGYEIYDTWQRLDAWSRAFGSEKSAIEFAKGKIDRLVRRIANGEYTN
jgi:hypothetical protein